MQTTTLNVSEVFYSLQGEGHRAGTANIFIRLQGCKAQHACAALGIKCDTEFESGKPMTLIEILRKISEHNCRNIIWTGGEPAQQLTADIVHFFSEKGYYQAIETSGLFPVHHMGLDFISVSPKVAEHVLQKTMEGVVDELRYVRHEGQSLPAPAVEAEHYFVSPHSDGWTINGKNLAHCIELCKANPRWRLSIQQHKVWSVL